MCDPISVCCDRCEMVVLEEQMQTDITGICVICMDCAAKEMTGNMRNAVINVLVEEQMRVSIEIYDKYTAEELVKKLHESGIDEVEKLIEVARNNMQ